MAVDSQLGEKEEFLSKSSEDKSRSSSISQKKSTQLQNLLNRWRSFAVVLIILDILLLIIVLTVVIVWVNDNNSREPLPHPQEYCLPKRTISLQVDDDRENFRNCSKELKYDTDGNELCCMSSHDNLNKLVDLYVKRRFRVDQAKEPHCEGNSLWRSKNESAARVVGYTGFISNEYRSYVVLWNDKSNKSFINDRISYRNGTFTVARKGFYYIYSQITFTEKKMTSKPSSNDRSMYMSLCHFVYRKRPNMPDTYHEKLLESSKSKCQLQTDQSNSTSYVGSVFYLEEEEKIMVKVTDPDKISGSEYSNYFGLHMI